MLMKKIELLFLILTLKKEYRGQGLALQLLIKVIEIAEKNKQFIVPLCGFAAKVMTENKQYFHLLEDKKNAGEGSNCDWRV
jgi:GNAT superfamily N-acetyltransferase